MDQGRERLTNRERQILECVSRGLANKEVASELCISEHTVKSQLKTIYLKLRVTSRSGAASAWVTLQFKLAVERERERERERES